MSETTEDVLKRFQMGDERFIQGLSIRDGFVSVQGEALIAMAAQLAAESKRADDLQGYYDRDTAKLKQEIQRLIAANGGLYWRWIGDGTDYLESLTCPILMDVGQMKTICDARYSDHQRLAAAEARAKGLEEAVRKKGEELRTGTHCRMCEHMQDMCDCKEISAEYDALLPAGEEANDAAR